MRRSARLAVAVAASGLSSMLLAPGAFAVSVGGFSVSPATFNPSVPSTRAYFQPTIRAGASFTGRVIVTNSGSSPVELLVYPVAGVTAVTSGAVYTNRQDPRRGAATWVHPAVNLVEVPAQSRLEVPFVVDVPARAKPGDHLAGLAFEGAHPRHSGGRFSIIEIIRAVVGIEVRVPGPASPQIRLRAVSLRALPGTRVPSVVVTLGDAGRLLCKPRLSVSLRRPGQARQTVIRQLDTILPGDVIPFPFPWPRSLRAGTYQTYVQASRCGRRTALQGNERLGSSLEGTPGDPSGPSHPATDGSTPLMLIVLIGVGGAVLGTALTMQFGRRRASRAA